MRRCPVFQRIDEIPKPIFDILRTELQNVKNLLLNLPPVDPHATATELVAVANQIIVLTLHLARVGVK